MQAAYLLRDKIPAGVSTAVLLIKFFLFPVRLCAVLGGVLRLHAAQAPGGEPGHHPLIILGLIINGGSIVFFRAVFYKPVLHALCRCAKWFTRRFPKLEKRFHAQAAIDKFEADFSTYSDDFNAKTKYIVLGILVPSPSLSCR